MQKKEDGTGAKAVVVVRHGERLDYVMRDRGENWIPTADRPWDPPLTETGVKQARHLGETLPSILRELRLPPVAAVYSSPFLRCRQTAAELASANDNSDAELKIQIELGLAESLNQNWFRSWAVHGTDGTWGFGKDTQPNLDPETLHPASKQPAHALLEWKQGVSDDNLLAKTDQTYVSQSTIPESYSLHPPKFEYTNKQRARMSETLNTLSQRHINETLVLVSHGGPVTHLFESLTGNRWQQHGVSKYCCYSIYRQSVGEESWTPLVVNQALETNIQEDTKGDGKSFAWD